MGNHPLKKLKPYNIEIDACIAVEDVERVSQIMQERGYDCPTMLAYLLWRDYSAERAAGWLDASDDEIEAALSAYYE